MCQVTASGEPDAEDEKRHHVQANDAGGPTGTGDAHGFGAEVSVEESPVAGPVDGGRGDKRDHNEHYAVNALKIKAQGHVSEQRSGRPDECMNISAGFGNDVGWCAEVWEKVKCAQGEEHNGGCAEEDEPYGLAEGAFAVGAVACSIGLRDQGVDASHEANSAEHDGVKNRVAERGC